MATKNRSAGNIMLDMVMVLVTLIIIGPMMIMLLGSFKNITEAGQFSLNLPSQWHPENYRFVIENANMLKAFFNSLLITSISMFATTILAAFAMFALVRRKTKIANFWSRYLFLGLVAPFQIITTVMLFKLLHISGVSAVILLFIATSLPFTCFLYGGYINTIPRDMDEAALIDGCNTLQTFWYVVFPLLIPITVTNIALNSIGIWNNFMIPLYFLNSTRDWTLPLTVYRFYGQYLSNWNYVFANLTLSAIPMIILYFLLQRYMITGMVSGAIKG